MSKIQVTQQPKILMFVPQYPYPVVGGLERQSHELSKALLRQSTQVIVLSGKINGEGPSQEFVEGVNVFRLPWANIKWLRSLQSTLALIWIMYKLRSQYNIVHIHNISWSGGLVLILGKLLGKKSLVKLPNSGEFGIPGIRTRFLGILLLQILKRSNVVIALSEDSAQELTDIAYPRRQVLKITNGISSAGYFTKRDTHNDTDLVKAIFAGRLSKEKGLFDLLGAWAKALENLPQSAILDICGDGPLKEALIDMVKELGIEGSVRILGHVEGMASLLGNADFFVLPSYFEGNSNAILEAMAAGLPIISTRVGGTPCLVGREGAKLLCSPGDQDALAKHLTLLISGPVLRRSYGAAMRKRVVNFFDIDAVTARYLSVYKHLLSPDTAICVSDLSSPIFAEPL